MRTASRSARPTRSGGSRTGSSDRFWLERPRLNPCTFHVVTRTGGALFGPFLRDAENLIAGPGKGEEQQHQHDPRTRFEQPVEKPADDPAAERIADQHRPHALPRPRADRPPEQRLWLGGALGLGATRRLEPGLQRSKLGVFARRLIWVGRHEANRPCEPVEGEISMTKRRGSKLPRQARLRLGTGRRQVNR